MLRIRETLRWFRLRILVERVALRADQAGALSLAPAFPTAMHARSMSRLAGADPSPIALNDRQVRGSLGMSCKGPVILGSLSRRWASSQPMSWTTRSNVLA